MMGGIMRIPCRTGHLAALLLLALPAATVAQPAVPQRPGPYLFVLDLAGTPLDEFPSSVKALNGTMTVVNKNGQHMLRASSPSELLITLPQGLPADFTVEVELIPKSCCNPEDLMVEGTPAMNRGPASAQLSWHPKHLMVVGGGEMYQSDMPADLAVSTPGNLTSVVMAFSGATVKLYTNGRRLFTLDRQFVRGRVLRVWLGGQDEGANAVYLAGLRVGTGAVAPGIIAGNEGLPVGRGVPANPQINQQPGPVAANPAPPPGQPTPTPPPGQPAPALAPAPVNPVLVGPTTGKITPTPAGPTLTTARYMFDVGGWGITVGWDAVPNATAYRVYRKDVQATPGSLLATLTAAEATWKMGTATLDPDADWLYYASGKFDPREGRGYWVEAVFADGSVSSPGPFATPDFLPAPTPNVDQTPITIPNLKVTVGGTRTGSWNGKQTPGGDVTWTWDQWCSSPTCDWIPAARLYHVAIIVPSSATSAPPQVIDTRVLRSPDPSPIHVMTSATAVGPPLTIFYPTGMTVGACVAPLDIGKILMAGRPLPVGVSCASIQVP
jgi:hypothetical protein